MHGTVCICIHLSCWPTWYCADFGTLHGTVAREYWCPAELKLLNVCKLKLLNVP